MLKKTIEYEDFKGEKQKQRSLALLFLLKINLYKFYRVCCVWGPKISNK